MKQLVTFSFVVSLLLQAGLAQDSTQMVRDSKDTTQTARDSTQFVKDTIQIVQDSVQTVRDSNQIVQDSTQTIKDTTQIKQDSVQTARDLVQTEPESAQTAKFSSPYTTTFKNDAPITIAGLGLTAFGVYLIQKKKGLTPEELLSKTKDRIPFFDRGNAGFYSKKANDDSYVPFGAAFAMPVVFMLINKNEMQKFGQTLSLYIQTMAITGALFTIAAGAIDRSRPLVYGSEAPLSLRLAGKSQRSFYAGHTAAAAAASFFAARVFQDFNPDSKAKPYVWIVAATVPAIAGYLRYRAGMHFLSDNILGYVIGGATGILIPKWHKSKALKNFNVTPVTGYNYKGVSLNYHF